MEPLAALAQVFVWLAGMAVVLAGLELSLYWWLYRFGSRLYWPVSVMIAVAGGGLVSLVAAPEDRILSGAGAALGLALLAGLAKVFLRGRWRVALMMLAPAFLVTSLLLIYPFFFELRLAFANLNLYTIAAWLQGSSLSWAGFTNFVKVFTTSPLQTATFWDLLWRTVLWTAINLVFHVGFGLGLALLLNRPLKGRVFTGPC